MDRLIAKAEALGETDMAIHPEGIVDRDTQPFELNRARFLTHMTYD